MELAEAQAPHGAVPTMRARALLGPGRFGTIEVARPSAEQLRADEVLLRVVAGGICGSDGPFFLGAANRWADPAGASAPDAGAPVPVPPGHHPGFPMHEVVGEIVASTDPDLPVGESVVGWASRFDGLCEYVVTDSLGLSRYDPSLLPEDAVLVQPLACVLFAVERIGDVTGRACAVIGQGAIGLLFAHVLRSRGARSVVTVDRVDRSAAARRIGVDEFVWSSSGPWCRALAANARPDVVVEAVGHQTLTLQDAIDAAAPSGRIFYFGVPDDPVYPVDMESMVRKHLTLMAGGTLGRRRMLAEADAYLRRHPDLIPALISHRFQLGEVQQAYDLAFRSPGERLKVVVSMRGAPAVAGQI